MSGHLAPEACYICGEGAHPDTTNRHGHRFWSNADAAREFMDATHPVSVYPSGARTPEEDYVRQHRPY